jgi:phage terminase small subunit
VKDRKVSENLSREEAKQAMKEALKEWMDEKFVEVGKWSVMTIAVAALGALTYFILTANGWHK